MSHRSDLKCGAGASERANARCVLGGGSRERPRRGGGTVGYSYVKMFDTPGYRTPSRDDSRQYERAAPLGHEVAEKRCVEALVHVDRVARGVPWGVDGVEPPDRRAVRDPPYRRRGGVDPDRDPAGAADRRVPDRSRPLRDRTRRRAPALRGRAPADHPRALSRVRRPRHPQGVRVGEHPRAVRAVRRDVRLHHTAALVFTSYLGFAQVATVAVARNFVGTAGAITILIAGLLATLSSANASILSTSR